MDANEYALAVKPAEKSLGVLIRSAIWLGGPGSADARPQSVRSTLKMQVHLTLFALTRSMRARRPRSQ